MGEVLKFKEKIEKPEEKEMSLEDLMGAMEEEEKKRTNLLKNITSDMNLLKDLAKSNVEGEELEESKKRAIKDTADKLRESIKDIRELMGEQQSLHGTLDKAEEYIRIVENSLEK